MTEEIIKSVFICIGAYITAQCLWTVYRKHIIKEDDEEV